MKFKIKPLLTLLSLLNIAASSAFAATNNQQIQLLEERVTILEHQKNVSDKETSYSPVTVLPQLNLREKFNTTPPYNQDLQMLMLKKRFKTRSEARSIPPLAYPRIELGGSLNVFAQERKPPIGSSHSNLNLNGATLNAAAEITDWLLAYLNLGYDPNPAPKFARNTPTSFDTNAIANSHIYLSTGFMTFGDLTKFPLYLTVGQTFLPFGQYRTFLLGAPLTARLGRMRQRAILIGFQQPHTMEGLSASLFAFKGNTKFANHTNINNGGLNAQYHWISSIVSLDVGGSYIANIADSGGMQETGPSTIVSVDGLFIDDELLDDEDDNEFPTVTTPTFTGFNGQETLVHRVQGADIRAKIDVKRIPITLIGEYNRAIGTFSPNNLSYNGRGAQPSAWHLEGAFRFHIKNIPSSIAIGYDTTKEALSINLPKSSTGAAFVMGFNRYLSGGLEYRYDKNYASGNFATGQGLPVLGNNIVGKTAQSAFIMLNARF